MTLSRVRKIVSQFGVEWAEELFLTKAMNETVAKIKKHSKIGIFNKCLA